MKILAFFTSNKCASMNIYINFLQGNKQNTKGEKL